MRGNSSEKRVGRGHRNIVGHAVTLATTRGEQRRSRERQELVHSHADTVARVGVMRKSAPTATKD
jgi:hypothetical protein